MVAPLQAAGYINISAAVTNEQSCRNGSASIEHPCTLHPQPLGVDANKTRTRVLSFPSPWPSSCEGHRLKNGGFVFARNFALLSTDRRTFRRRFTPQKLCEKNPI